MYKRRLKKKAAGGKGMIQRRIQGQSVHMLMGTEGSPYLATSSVIFLGDTHRKRTPRAPWSNRHPYPTSSPYPISRVARGRLSTKRTREYPRRVDKGRRSENAAECPEDDRRKAALTREELGKRATKNSSREVQSQERRKSILGRSVETRREEGWTVGR